MRAAAAAIAEGKTGSFLIPNFIMGPALNFARFIWF